MFNRYPAFLLPRPAAGVVVILLTVLLLMLDACAPRMARKALERDPDGDGVALGQDKCPDTPPGVAVDANGCPLDTDGDGVADAQDRCPTEKGLPALAGCPDQDGDGVADIQDRCPDRPGPASNKGCPEIRVMASMPAPAAPDPIQAMVQAQEKKEKNKRMVTVFFCTNRNLLPGNPKTPKAISFGKAKAITRYGTCQVSIPRDHRLGQVELPATFLGFEIGKPNPAKNLILESTKLLSQADLLTLMNQKSSASANRDAFVFVHGFNNNFKTALFRTAQFTYDLGFKGAPVLFSWPSQGSGLAYRLDEQMNQASVEPFKAFMRTFLQKSSATNIYLIAHSMGNRIMLATLQDLMLREPQLFRNRHVREIVLTAPDISVADFKTRIAPVINGKLNVTLYASSNDRALELSQRLNRNMRAGQAGPGMLLMRGVETIDATGVSTDFLGHSYFASEGTVMSDLHYLFVDSMRASKRAWLMQPKGKSYWTFRRPLKRAVSVH
ncbi:alpha/beta hydrolase [Hymenobacter artigasi]|uniref:Esterase/lipase superfamily enzyme n=1 Tax=Hymenobacter artigasi TaxID=2719616 RepID=A0ABX1HIF5_9BACT|nr:alpha/beta hydrolase [Hymenobacter artigasi]NKI88922.1 esterase/lipase superfamily enzyme [Hymenobacter artigasi]